MTSKKVNDYIYKGLGFPIQIKSVVMVEIDNEWHPKINVKKISDVAIKALMVNKDRLTGNQVKFIRHYFSLSLRQFGSEVVNESHMAVSKWEKFGDDATNMDLNIEMMIKLFLHEKLAMKTDKQKSEFYKKYLALKKTYHELYQKISSKSYDKQVAYLCVTV